MKPNSEGVGQVGVKNNLDIPINPATEETLQDLLSALGGGNTTIADGSKNITTAGTRETLVSSPTPCKRVIITARYDNDTNSNMGIVVVGGSTVVAAQAGRRGTPLIPGQTIDIAIDDAQKVYIDSINNGDGVTFIILD